MEKIIFNTKELEIYGLSNNGNKLEIYFNNGDIVMLENIFSKQEDLEKIILTDINGSAMTAYKNFVILKSIHKDKNVTINEIEDIVTDIVTITLEQEPEWKTETRKLAEMQNLNTAGILDLAETLSGIAERGGN